MMDTGQKNESVSYLKQLAKSGGLYFIALMLSKLATYSFRWVGTRLGPKNYGDLVVALSFNDLALVFATLAMDQTVLRFSAEHNAEGRAEATKTLFFGLKTVLVCSIIASLFVFFSAKMLAEAYNRPNISTILSVIAFGLPFSALTGVLVAAAKGVKFFEVEIVAKYVIESLSRPVVGLMAITLGFDVLGISLAIVFSSILSFLYALYRSKKIFGPVNWAAGIYASVPPAGLLKYSLPLFAVSILGILYSSISAILLGFYLSTESAGLFSLTVLVSTMVTAPAAALMSFFLPLETELINEGKKQEAVTVYHSVTKIIAIFVVPASLVCAYYSVEILRFLFGPSYIDGAIALSVLSIGGALSVLFFASGTMLLVLKRVDLVLIDTVLYFSATLLLSVLMVKPFGLAGAAFALTVPAIFNNILAASQDKRVFGIPYISKQTFRVFLSAIAAAMILFAWSSFTFFVGSIRTLSGVAVFGLAYVISLFLLRVFDDGDFELIRSVERRSGVKLPFIRSLLTMFYS